MERGIATPLFQSAGRHERAHHVLQWTPDLWRVGAQPSRQAARYRRLHRLEYAERLLVTYVCRSERKGWSMTAVGRKAVSLNAVRLLPSSLTTQAAACP